MKWWIALIVGIVAYVIYEIMFYLFGKFVKSDWRLRIICSVITVTICVGGLFLGQCQTSVERLSEDY